MKDAFWLYHFSSPWCRIISGIFKDILDITSFMTSMSGSLTSTSIVIFTRPFFSSAMQPPPYAFKPIRQQVIKKVLGLLLTQIQVYLNLIMELANPLGAGLVVED